MVSANLWLEGARLRTLPAAVAPVIIGAGIATFDGAFSAIRTLLAAGVALAFQIGVNFSNDYSDGVRGTDDFREGPPRLTGGGQVRPKVVLAVALSFFALACVLGLILVALSGHWWLLILGAGAALAAWFYTGGKHPYGYLGLGEIFVMAFFGWMATVGTAYVQTNSAPWYAWVAGTAVGLIACALLMVNNIRDIPTDIRAGKRTLAVRLGDGPARASFIAMLVIAYVTLLVFAAVIHGATGLAVILLAPALLPAILPVLRGETGRALITSLKFTGIFELLYAIVFAVILATA